MKTITQNLQSELKSKLKTADEIWVAVALMTKKGLEFIQENLSENAKQNYVLGVDLPTDPLALDILYKQRLKNVSVKMFYKQEFYHPKVYIIKSKKTYTAFVGSANCTKSGLFSNIELSFTITSQSDCIELLTWYKAIDDKSASLTYKFIKDYRLTYNARLLKKVEDEKSAKKSKEKLKEEYEVVMRSRKALIKKLIKYRNNPDYKKTKRIRKGNINDIRRSLDYPNFQAIDVEEFFSIWELGHLIAIPKPTIIAEIGRFRQMLRVLTDETLDIAVRVDRALKGDLRIRGVAVATITKILTIHNPKKYSIKNDKIDSILEKYGIEFPKRISEGEKYKATNKFLIEICNETGIDDLSILDFYLFTAANE